MDELIKMVSDKTGIGIDKAQDAVNTVMSFLKDKLPGPIGDQIESVIGGTSQAAHAEGSGFMSDVKDKASEIFGR